MTWDELLDFDRQHIWHPYTSLVNPLPVYPVESACGTRINLADGRQLVDGMASWWCAIHGYNHPVLNQAVKKQLDSTAHVMFGGLTHEPAVRLSSRLAEITPPGLDKIFFSDSGSVSVEVALKMALQYWQAMGDSKKTRFMSLKKGYHGDTFGAMSVCDPVTGMHSLFSSFLAKNIFVDSPDCGFQEECPFEIIEDLTGVFENHAHETAAFILEPVVQGAGGMKFYSPDFLKVVSRLCRKYQVLLIADEIATGFGRTGKLFACEHAEVTPDIMCLGKAMTGGYLSMAATLCTPETARVICSQEPGVFMHGPTFMGNPLASAVSLASIELLLSSPWRERVRKIEAQLKEELAHCLQKDRVKDVRALGAIGVVEMQNMVDTLKAQKFFVEQGVWIRPFLNLIYIMPSYNIEQEDLHRLTRAMSQAVEIL
ncbi:MAG: adenosylmethionine--8-amino-7-oxononanoate transaminase [Desulfonatronovibrionaceae bacterium]